MKSNFKKKKMKRFCSGVDRLSALPDALVHHILSFLDMKVVVQTSLVSKRWRHLWKSVPNLNFHLDYLPRKGKKKKLIHFMNFVDRVFILRDSNIDTFNLESREILDVNRITSWIIGAVGRHAQELNVKSDTSEPQELPYNLFTSDIKVMKLISYDNMRLPSSMSTSGRIRSLYLDGVQLPNGNSNGELVLSCLVLETLVMHRCDLEHIKVLTVSAPLLENLELSYLRTKEDGSFKFYTCNPNLKSFTCISTEYMDCCLENLSSLVSANIDICVEDLKHHKGKEACAKFLIKVLSGITNVKSLTLQTLSVEILTDFPELFGRLPDFHNLRYIVLSDWFRGSNIHAAVNFLGRFPHVETLVLEDLKIDMNPEKEEEYWIDIMSLQSIFDHLKIFEIRDLRMCTDDLTFLGVFLKRAIVLKKLIIIIDSSNDIEVEEFKRKLVELPRASSGVSFLFFEE